MTVTERRNSEAIATVDFDECLSKDSSDHLLGRVLAGKNPQIFIPLTFSSHFSGFVVI